MNAGKSVLWRAESLAEATGGRWQGGSPSNVCGISIDSRSVDPDDAFFAILGDRFDGHHFVDAALDAGASMAVISEARAQQFDGKPGTRIVVPDVLGALEDLGRAARARMDGPVIAVTGSVGKTGTKEALRLALAPSGRVHAAERSFNNHWGVPLTLARMPADSDFGVFEIGMNHPGEIRPLVGMVRPHIAIITTIAPVHLGFFDSVEGIARAKAEIFEGVQPGGTAILNANNEYFDFLKDLARQQTSIERIASFGRGAEADVRLLESRVVAEGSRVSANVFGRRIDYLLGAPGDHLVGNSLAVLAAASLAGADLDKAAAALTQMRAPRGRGARSTLFVDGAPAMLIDESYNANPASTRAALDLLGASAPEGTGRRIAVLGDMLELGDASEDYHVGLLASVLDNRTDLVCCCGPMMRLLWDRLPEANRMHYSETSDGLVDPVLDGLRPGDVVMVKGSLGSRMGPVVEALLSRFGAGTSGAEPA